MIHLDGIVILQSDTEVVHPSLKIGTDFPAPAVVHRNAPTTTSEAAQFGFKPREGFLKDSEPFAGEGEPEKGALLGLHHLAFVPIDPNSELALKEPADTCHHPFSGASGLHQSRYLFCVSRLRDSYPSTATGYAGSLVNRIDLLRIFLMNLLSRDAQISPDKNVNFPCTIPSADGTRTFALRLPSDGRSPFRPCFRLILLVVSIIMNTIDSRTGDFHPISSRPCRAYTKRFTGSA